MAGRGFIVACCLAALSGLASCQKVDDNFDGPVVMTKTSARGASDILHCIEFEQHGDVLKMADGIYFPVRNGNGEGFLKSENGIVIKYYDTIKGARIEVRSSQPLTPDQTALFENCTAPI